METLANAISFYLGKHHFYFAKNCQINSNFNFFDSKFEGRPSWKASRPADLQSTCLCVSFIQDGECVPVGREGLPGEEEEEGGWGGSGNALV